MPSPDPTSEHQVLLSLGILNIFNLRPTDTSIFTFLKWSQSSQSCFSTSIVSLAKRFHCWLNFWSWKPWNRPGNLCQLFSPCPTVITLCLESVLIPSFSVLPPPQCSPCRCSSEPWPHLLAGFPPSGLFSLWSIPSISAIRGPIPKTRA